MTSELVRERNRLSTLANWTLAKRLVSETAAYRPETGLQGGNFN